MTYDQMQHVTADNYSKYFSVLEQIRMMLQRINWIDFLGLCKLFFWQWKTVLKLS